MNYFQVWKIQNAYPMNPSECLCVPKNETVLDLYGSSNTFTPLPEESARLSACEFESNGISLGGFQSPGCHYVPNVFMTCVVLFAGTYILTK